MPRYLALYTPFEAPQPTPEKMQQMAELMQRQMQAGKVISTGGIKKRETHGLRVSRRGGKTNVEEGGAAWAAASGWAILQANSREALIADVEEFLTFAGDGVSEIIELFEPPAQ